MFDIGFWELLLIGLVALVVIGPERLPKVARVVGLWVGKARNTLGSVKAEIDRELKAQELKEIIDKQTRSNPLETILEEPRRGSSSPTGSTPGSMSGPTPGSPGKPTGSASSAPVDPESKDP
jgi:sec-independent protein translocase protein TatB